MNRKIKNITFMAIMTSAALILSYIEHLLPPVFPAVPAVKIGLPNIVIIILLYRLSFKEAFTVSILRVFLSSLLFGSFVTFLYSFSGAILSLAVMTLFKKIGIFSKIAVSILGGIFHNIGQIVVAIFVLETIEIAYYGIVLSLFGIISGLLVGCAGAIILKYFEKIKIKF